MQIATIQREGHVLRHTATLAANETERTAAPAKQSASQPAPRRLLSLKDVGLKLGVSLRTAHKVVAEDWFPSPIELAPRVRRWVEQEIDEALAQRAPRRSGPQPEPQQLLRGKIERLKGGAEA